MCSVTKSTTDRAWRAAARQFSSAPWLIRLRTRVRCSLHPLGLDRPQQRVEVNVADGRADAVGSEVGGEARDCEVRAAGIAGGRNSSATCNTDLLARLPSSGRLVDVTDLVILPTVVAAVAGWPKEALDRFAADDLAVRARRRTATRTGSPNIGVA